MPKPEGAWYVECEWLSVRAMGPKPPVISPAESNFVYAANSGVAPV